MSFLEFEHAIAPRIILPLLAGLLALTALNTNASAADKNTFVIDETEGYGITECLSGGKSCGRVVADAWCEAHGLGAATAYGKADDITASTSADSAAAKVAARPGAVIVTCAN